MTYVLLGPDRRPYRSATPGRLGGHRRGKLYGRLDCPVALHAIAAGGYVAHRVFFVDEATAVAAGYRPCAVCLPEAYRQWQRPAARPGQSPLPARSGAVTDHRWVSDAAGRKPATDRLGRSL